jgi:hypothetical protein
VLATQPQFLTLQATNTISTSPESIAPQRINKIASMAQELEDLQLSLAQLATEFLKKTEKDYEERRKCSLINYL